MKREPNKQSRYVFDENGANEVSEQIMNSYHSGYIDQETEIADNVDFPDLENM